MTEYDGDHVEMSVLDLVMMAMDHASDHYLPESGKFRVDDFKELVARQLQDNMGGVGPQVPIVDQQAEKAYFWSRFYAGKWHDPPEADDNPDLTSG